MKKVVAVPEWKRIPGYPNFAACETGHVANLTTRQHVEPNPSGRYLAVRLTDGCGGKAWMHLHRLIACVFHGLPPFPGAMARHLDGNSMNNAASNIRWGTAAENNDDRRRHGTMPWGESHSASRFTKRDVTEMKRRIAKGESAKSVAARFGTTDHYVYAIVRGTTWALLRTRYDEDAWAAIRRRITPDQQREMAKLRESGVPVHEIAARFGITRTAVRFAIKRLAIAAKADGRNAKATGTKESLPPIAAGPDYIWPPNGTGDNWRCIFGLRLLVGSDGTVWDSIKGEAVKPKLHPRGHTEVVVKGEMGETITYSVARLVISSFEGGPPFGGAVVRHLNDDPADNRLENLAWGSHADNMDDRIRLGTSTRGEAVWSAKLTEEDVLAIRAERKQHNTPYKVLARRYGVSVPTISMLVTGQTWTHLLDRETADENAAAA